MRTSKIAAVLTGAALMLSIGAGAANAASTRDNWEGNYDCTSLQRQVTSTGKAQEWISVRAGSKNEFAQGPKGPYQVTAYSGLFKTTWYVSGYPSIQSGGPGCSIK